MIAFYIYVGGVFISTIVIAYYCPTPVGNAFIAGLIWPALAVLAGGLYIINGRQRRGSK